MVAPAEALRDAGNLPGPDSLLHSVAPQLSVADRVHREIRTLLTRARLSAKGITPDYLASRKEKLTKAPEISEDAKRFLEGESVVNESPKNSG